jgi:hypothetical protein
VTRVTLQAGAALANTLKVIDAHTAPISSRGARRAMRSSPGKASWRDQNLKYHQYQPLDPSPRIQDLLDYLDSRADPGRS